MFGGDKEMLTRTEHAQPAILVHSVAALETLKTRVAGFDVKTSCRATMGHSLGEYTALVASECLNLEDAVRLVRARGEAMSKQQSLNAPQKMVALMPADADTLRPVLKSDEVTRKGICDVANINSSSQIVLSGHADAVDCAVRLAKEKHLARKAIPLKTSAAFHSRLMRPAAETLRVLLDEVPMRKPLVPLISNVTAKEISSRREIRRLLLELREARGKVGSVATR